MDPSPFQEKDLDRDAEEFIVSWANEFPRGSELSLRVHLVEMPADDPTAMIADAVNNYFQYRRGGLQREFRQLMARGRLTLLIGLSFLAVCLLIAQYLYTLDKGPLIALLSEGLTIAGWVAMWRPMEIYLYEWWPIRRKMKLYEKLARMEVEVLPDARTGALTGIHGREEKPE